ncbi:MAG: cyclopropane-fatty-acyl-phospholipid synthase family protein [Pacificimonas sp.]
MWLLVKLLDRLVKRGEVELVAADGTRRMFGTPDPEFGSMTLRLTDDGAAKAITRNIRLGFGEAWMDGRIAIEGGDLREFLFLIKQNVSFGSGNTLEGKSPLKGLKRLATTADRLNWRRRSRRNVAHHYDLSDRLYALFLDEDWQYSCAYFARPDMTLDEAQLAKKQHIAAKLALHPGQRVLDIGCGWGGMAIYLAKTFGVDVTGITLSEEQLKVAQRRAAEAGLQDKVRFRLTDYRDLTGSFDRIVSVGMFEHVGPPHYREFFRQCHRLLTKDGVMLLHTIGRMGGPGTTDAFTSKYIFPGGYIPALSEIVRVSERHKLIMTDCETLRLHYAKTLHAWYDRTVGARDEIVNLYDERFFRMWQLYLAGSEVAFRFGGMANYQLQYVKDRHALPLTRDYLFEKETALRGSD